MPQFDEKVYKYVTNITTFYVVKMKAFDIKCNIPITFEITVNLK